MNNILLLGAGMVARPAVRYLLDNTGCTLTIATRTESRAAALAGEHPRARTRTLLAEDDASLASLVAEHDLVISLLPAPLHPAVARACIDHGKNMVTTSYVSKAMRALHGAAQAAGVTLLNEIGVDPGIDHMSVMRIVNDVNARGGQIIELSSNCGGLPAPEANDNPWGYKVSWSARAVCTASGNPARYLLDGREIRVSADRLFADRRPCLDFDEVGALECYPNRDALDYIDTYGLAGIATLFRGTLRYPGWCATLLAMRRADLLNDRATCYPPGTTYRQVVADAVGAGPADDVRGVLAERMACTETDIVLDRLAWLGLLSDEPIRNKGRDTTVLDVVAERMNDRLAYRDTDRDMVVMCHHVVARYPQGPAERTISRLIEYGVPGGDSAMARTVSLPAAVAARLILEGRITARGVIIPVIPEICGPVLDELDRLGIHLHEASMVAE